MEMEDREKQRQHEFEMKKLELDANKGIKEEESQDEHVHSSGPKSTYIPKLPPFDENKDEIDSFLFRFESHATSCGWAKDKWPLFASSLFRGSALSLFHSLSAKQNISWEDLKSELLRKFQCTEEGFRNKFRNVRPEANESFAAFLIRSGHLLDRWIELSEVPHDFQNLRDLFLREQILQSVSKDLSIFLRERTFENADEMCKLADQYKSAHPNKSFSRKTEVQVFDSNVSSNPPSHSSQFGYRGRANYTYQQNRSNNFRQYSRGGERGRGLTRGGNNPRFSNPSQGQSFRPYQPRGKFFQPRGAQSGAKEAACWTCGCKFHMRNECPYTCSQTASVSETVQEVLVSKDTKDGLHIEECTVNGYAGTLLRDTGCTTAGVKRCFVRAEQFTGKTQHCRSFGGRIESFPLAEIQVDTPYYSGTVLACVIDSPVADLILGNLPGVKTSHGGQGGSLVCEPQALVTTRAQSKEEGKPTKPLKVPLIPNLDVKPDALKDLQRSDASLRSSFEKVKEEHMLKENENCFVLQDGLLYRIFQTKSGKVQQVVVPKKLRPTVLKVAHDLAMAGHCGVRRTLERVLSFFYWPTVRTDVTKFCQSCDVCQRSVSKGRIPCAPLQQMPVISEPFQRIAIDLVGPFVPASSSGNRYVLTIVDVATRYPEAIPLKKIDTVTVAEALFSVFCRMGCPSEVLSDCGTQFVSDLMTEVYRLLSVKSVTTTPYHPQSNGMVERFNGTLKSMLKKVAQEQPKDWDRFIPAVLFSYRELPNASTGFSPFELMFGRPARGPMYILSQGWSGKSHPDEKNMYQYVFDLKNRLAKTCSLAQEQLQASAKQYKHYADKKAKMRVLCPGQKVLVLLSDQKNKLQVRWKGPYIVLDKVNAVDYKIDMDGVTKTFHINMLKLYVERQENACVSVNANVVDFESVSGPLPISWNEIVSNEYLAQEQSVETEQICECERQTDVKIALVGVIKDTDEDGIHIPTVPSVTGETYMNAHIDPNLDSDKVEELRECLHQFSDILTDKPGLAQGVEPHCIHLTSDIPIRLRPYPLPFATRQVVEKEVQSMIDMGVIEKSTSPYCSPVVLVSKPDGSVRFCIDYRALNKITVFDSEPIPDMDELFSQLSQAKYFAKIDLTKGYWQIPVHPNDKQKTAFQTPLGLFQWTRMPFGLQNAPATFARMMRDLRLYENGAVSFFDDILLAVDVWSKLAEGLKQILGKLRSFGLTARPSKMMLGFSNLEFLGHTLSTGFMKPEKKKIEKILSVQVPKSKKQVRSLLGLLSYYRRYVCNFAEITAPLSDLTRESGKRGIDWTPQCQEALSKVQQILSAKPVLLLPDLQKDFLVRTDASSTGMGAVLLQERDGLLHPVQYASKKLSEAQKRYSTIERECLAIIWGLEKFQRFLLGRYFTLQTDHRPLTFLKSAETKNNRLLRWALALQEFKFDIVPISGHTNMFADLLSRE